MSYKHECLVTVIKPEHVASSTNIQHILKIFNKLSLGVGACVCAVCLCLSVSNNNECMHNPTFYIIKMKMCKFKICSIICYSCFIYAGTLSSVVYTYESVVMYVRGYTDWVVVFLFTMFLKCYEKH